MYLAFEADHELEFEFFLAQKLGMTVRRLRQEIDAMEFLQWGIFYARKAQREELEAKKAR